MKRFVIHKCGDRGKNHHTIRGGYVNALCSNPHSDETTMILEWDEETSIEDSEQRGCDETFLGEH